MHIATVKSGLLQAGLQKTVRVRSQNALLTSLECIHVKAIKGALVLTGTNLETTVITGVKADVKEVGKAFLIPFKVQNILKQLKDVEIEIHNGENLSFKYLDNVIKVAAEDPQEFPIAPQPEEVTRFKVEDYAEFRQLLDMHVKFTANDDLRPAMSGVNFRESGFMSTDGNRLAITKYDGGDVAFEAIIPKLFITAMAGINAAFTVQICKAHIVAFDKECKIITRLIDANFPDVRAVLPKDSGIHIEVDRLELVQNVKLALNMTDKSTKRLRLDFAKDGYELLACDNDLTEEIKLKGGCTWKVNKAKEETFAVGFNGDFLNTQLGLLNEEKVTLELSAPKKACLFHEADNLFVLMPIAL